MRTKRLTGQRITALTTVTAVAGTLVACAADDEPASPEPVNASSTVADSGIGQDAQESIDRLNDIFTEAESNVDWQPGYYRDVYSRIEDEAAALADAVDENDNPQLRKDAGILRDQAAAMLREEPQFETDDRPAQLENRYTRADMQLWRDRLEFAVANPDNDDRPTAGVKQVSQDEASASNGEFDDLETYSDNAGEFSVDFTVIPTGSFEMGGEEEEWERQNVDPERREWESPKHHVDIEKRYGIMNTEVTREMFAHFVEETGYATAPGGIGFPPPPDSTDPESSMYREGVTWQEPGIPQETDRHPVVQVSRADAQAFARWLSAKTGQVWRLPTEAEWEYAARAGTDTAYYWGDDINDGNEYAAGYDVRTDEATGYGFTPIMETDDGSAYTAEVGSYKPNAWGLYDMTGNAREWMEDYWEPNYDSGPATQDPRTGGEPTFPVLRGGAWDYMPQNLRIAYRSAYYNNYIHSTMWGFRLVREL